jgi:tetratricopeptide (TPR) repeat protein
MLKDEFSEIEKYLSEGKIERAINSFEELLAKYPQDLPLKLSFADFLLKIQEPFYALEILREGLKIDSENLDLRYLLGVAQQKANRFRLAEKEFEFVKSKKPFDPEIIRQLGWTKVMMGEIGEGRKLLREAISADLMNPLPYADLGASYIFTLDFEEGFRWLETAKNLKPEDHFISERIKEAKRMERDFQKFPEKEKEKLKELRRDKKELKLMTIETMLNLQMGMEPTKEEMEDIKKELELAGVNPKFVEFKAPRAEDERTQIEYLEYHSKVENVERRISKEEFEKLKERLLNEKNEVEIKKILIILAHQGTKEAIKLLEKYQTECPTELKDFANLALEECKVSSQAPAGKFVKIIH